MIVDEFDMKMKKMWKGEDEERVLLYFCICMIK